MTDPSSAPHSTCRHFAASIMLAAAIAVTLAAPAAFAQVVGLAARVNGTPITNERLELFFEAYSASKGRSVASFRSPEAYKRWKREALDVLIDEELLWQEAQRKTIAVGPKELEEAVAEQRARFPSGDAFARQLRKSGLTEETFPGFLRRQMSIEKLIQRDVAGSQKVTEAEIHQYYQENRGGLARAAGGEANGEQQAAPAIRKQLVEEKTQQAVRELLDTLRRSGKIELIVPL